jgi:hypothetical protein
MTQIKRVGMRNHKTSSGADALESCSLINRIEDFIAQSQPEMLAS